MIEIEGLCIERPGFALGPLSLRVEEGEYFMLLGPSGAGKTTLIEWMAGFVGARKGTLRIGGRDVTSLPPQERGLGIVYQDLALFPHLSVAENLAFPLQMAGWEGATQQSRVDELAELLHLEERLGSLPRQLSGGEQRRAALGRALAAGRKILLLDEPLEGLDPDLRRELRQELAALQRRLGLTIFHITHHLGEVRALATRLAVLLGGAIVQTGGSEEVFARPASAPVARFLTVANFVEGEADPAAKVIRLAGGPSLPAPVGRAGPVRARAEGLTLALDGAARGSVPAMLKAIEQGGAGGRRALVEVICQGEGPSFPFEAQLSNGAPAPDIEPGSQVWLDFSGANWVIY